MTQLTLSAMHRSMLSSKIVPLLVQEMLPILLKVYGEVPLFQPFLKLFSGLVMENSPRWCNFTARMIAKFRNMWEALWGPGHNVLRSLRLLLNMFREMSTSARWYSIWIPPFQKPPKTVQNLPPCFGLDMDNGCAWFVKRREMNTMKKGETKHPVTNVLKHSVIWNMKA